jgi:hypothetical protein
MLELITPAMPLPQGLQSIIPERSSSGSLGLPSFAALPSLARPHQAGHPSLASHHEPPGITVYIGSHRIEIGNNADGAAISQVLKAVSQI